MGRVVILARKCGRTLRWRDGLAGLAIHPSAVLRMPDESARAQGLGGFTHDLRLG
jgi:DNA polymerase